MNPSTSNPLPHVVGLRNHLEKLRSRPAPKPSKLFYPNQFHPDQVKTRYSVDVYQGGSYLKSSVKKVSIGSDASVESCSKPTHRNGRTNAHVKEFSWKARRSMLQQFSMLDMSKVFSPGLDVYLLTFTISFFEKYPGWIKKAWKNFRDCFEREYPESAGIFRWDFTLGLRAAPHIHLVAIGLPKMRRGSRQYKDFCKWITDKWYDCVYQDNDEIRKEYPNHGNSVDVEKANSVDAIFQYVSSYSASKKDNVPSWWSNSHHWGIYNRSVFQTFKTKVSIELDEKSHREVHSLITGEINKKIKSSAKKRCRIVVSNLSKLVLESDLEYLFNSHGTVTEVEIVRMRNGVSMGYGYVYMENQKELENAAKVINGFELLGKAMKVTQRQTYLVKTFAIDRVSTPAKIDRKTKHLVGDSVEFFLDGKTIKEDVVDYAFGKIVVRKAYDPISKDLLGFVVSKGDETDKQCYQLLNDSGKVLRDLVHSSECRFLKFTGDCNTSVGAYFCDELDEKVSKILSGNFDALKSMDGKRTRELQEQADALGVPFEELVTEVGYVGIEALDAHGLLHSSRGLSHVPNSSTQGELTVTQ